MIYLLLLAAVLVLSYSYLPTIGLKSIKFNSNLNNRVDKKLALTFDDGIDSDYTPKVLDILDDYNIKGNFFLMTETIDENKDILKRIIEEGHSVGIHCYEHKSLMLKSFKETIEEIDKSFKILAEQGVETKLYRPPHGHINLPLLLEIKNRGLKLVLWDVIVGDWKKDNNEEKIANDLLSMTKNGSIICLHDGRGEDKAPARTVEALKIAIPSLLDDGYRFVKLDDYYGI